MLPVREAPGRDAMADLKAIENRRTSKQEVLESMRAERAAQYGHRHAHVGYELAQALDAQALESWALKLNDLLSYALAEHQTGAALVINGLLVGLAQNAKSKGLEVHIDPSAVLDLITPAKAAPRKLVPTDVYSTLDPEAEPFIDPENPPVEVSTPAELTVGTGDDVDLSLYLNGLLSFEDDEPEPVEPGASTREALSPEPDPQAAERARKRRASRKASAGTVEG